MGTGSYQTSWVRASAVLEISCLLGAHAPSRRYVLLRTIFVDFPTLTRARLVRRYKRFLADVEWLESQGSDVVHCPNTGAMTGCCDAGAQVWLSYHDNPRRKLSWTWELVETSAGLACIHSARANRVVEEALEKGFFPELLSPGAEIRREPPLGQSARADFFLESNRGVYVEVKAVTLHRGASTGAFPDTTSLRATKHLQELMRMMVQGHRAALIFCILHAGIEEVSAAADIDPEYACQLAVAMDAGLEVFTLLNDISPRGIYPQKTTRLGSP